MSLCSGYVLSAVLFSAAELKLFDHLGGPLSEAPVRAGLPLAELARTTLTRPEALSRLLVMLGNLGLVQRGRDGLYHNTSLSERRLRTDRPGSLHPVLLHHQHLGYPLLEGVTEALRTGRAQTHRLRFLSDADRAAQTRTPRDCYSLLLAYPNEYRIFLQMMDATSAGVGELISKQVGFADISTLVDVGGGGGQIHRELLQQNPRLTVLMLDLEPACRYAAEQAARAGLSSRVRFVHGSMFDAGAPPPIEGADAVLLAGVLADWELQEQRAIVLSAKRMLRPGGCLLVSETLLNAERTGPMLPALLSIFMLLATRGDNLTAPETTTLLKECGFVDLEIHDNAACGMRDLIVARTPRSN